MKNKKYVIYKISGGLNHMLNQINNAIHLSKQTNRFLIIDCNGHAFKNDFNKYFNIPNYVYDTNYECLYENVHLEKKLYEPYINIHVKYTPAAYFLLNKNVTISYTDSLKNDDKIIYCSWIKGMPQKIPWYIKVNSSIINDISKNKINDIYVGVHYRNTDTKNDIKKIIAKINELKNKSSLIYLATDDYRAFDNFKEKLANFKIIQYTKPYNNKGGNIHYGNPNKDEVIMNALIDMYHLTEATYFIPSERTSFSKRITQLRVNNSFFNL